LEELNSDIPVSGGVILRLPCFGGVILRLGELLYGISRGFGVKLLKNTCDRRFGGVIYSDIPVSEESYSDLENYYTEFMGVSE